MLVEQIELLPESAYLVARNVCRIFCLELGEHGTDSLIAKGFRHFFIVFFLVESFSHFVFCGSLGIDSVITDSFNSF